MLGLRPGLPRELNMKTQSAIVILSLATLNCSLPVNGTEIPPLATPPTIVVTSPPTQPPQPVIPTLDAGDAGTTLADLFDNDANTGDIGLNSPSLDPNCHAPVAGYTKDYPSSWCPKGYVSPTTGDIVSSLNITLYAQSTIFLSQDPSQTLCRPGNVPAACISCDYTCDCLLKALCETGTNCTCEQATPGGIILFGPLPLQ